MNTGVLLLNLGGPETLRDVRPFLYNLFSDPEIIRIRSAPLRRLFAWTLAAARRRKSEGLYRQIGGGSPLRRITEAQAAALRRELEARGREIRVYVGMLCARPSIEEAAGRIAGDGIRRLTVLPLFPQYSSTTSGSCLKRFEGLAKKLGLEGRMKISVVRSWFDEPRYVECMADLAREGLQKFSRDTRDDVFVLYSAHSIPARRVDEGDPYLGQTQQTVALIRERLGVGNDSALAFQSRLGPVRWLGPETREVLVVPVSFVSDHVETLQEIDIAYRGEALRWGVREFVRASPPNLHPAFIEALANLVAGPGA